MNLKSYSPLSSHYRVCWHLRSNNGNKHLTDGPSSFPDTHTHTQYEREAYIMEWIRSYFNSRYFPQNNFWSQFVCLFVSAFYLCSPLHTVSGVFLKGKPCTSLIPSSTPRTTVHHTVSINGFTTAPLQKSFGKN